MSEEGQLVSDFFIGTFSGLFVSFLIYMGNGSWWPRFLYRFIHKGIRVDGCWEISEFRNNRNKMVGKIDLKQKGYLVSGKSTRSKTRAGVKSNREFIYTGVIHGNQLTLQFDDKKGSGFDTGTYVFIIQNDGVTMHGMATFHGKVENKIVSESRTLKKLPS